MPPSNKVLLFTLCTFVTLLLSNCRKEETQPAQKVEPNSFGLIVDSLIEVHGTINPGETLGDILIPHGLSDEQIFKISEKAEKIFPVKNFKAGDEYYLYAQWDTVETVKYLVYVRDPVEYVVFDLSDSVNIYSAKKEVEVKESVAQGTIKNSLWQTLESLNIDQDVAVKLSEIYAWQIDFFSIQPSDSFKVVYQQSFVEGKPVGVGKILTAMFRHAKNDYYAFRFEHGSEAGYYDEKGNTLRRAFLKAPLKFSRISSRYSMRRFHPILGRVKSHLGTDYAAPTGTPILSVGDGIVTDARYTSGNGNYVKIKHNATYTTQYLHMSKFAKGIRTGVRVKQGQLIGYVGSTGLATGPHVCFRFWKNGKQVDPLREKIPNSQPIDKKLKAEFDLVKNSLADKLRNNGTEVVTSSQHSGTVN